MPELALGYGVLFGLGGGVGFIVVQQGVNQTMQARIGLVNGYVIALYPLGAMIGAPLFGWAIAAYGLRPTLMALTLTVLAASLLSAALLRLADIRMHDASVTSPADHDPQWPIFLRLFGVFFLAAAAGLMVMSQAAGIVQAYGGQLMLALAATTVITGAIAVARLTGGWLVDHFAARHVAAGAHLFSLTGAVALSLWPTPLVAVASLAMIGLRCDLRQHRWRDRQVLAPQCFWRRREPALHCLVCRGGEPAGAVGLALRPNPGLRHRGDDRRSRQCAGRIAVADAAQVARCLKMLSVLARRFTAMPPIPRTGVDPCLTV